MPGQRVWDSYLLCTAFVWLEIAFSSAAVRRATELPGMRNLLALAAVGVAPFALIIGVGMQALAGSRRHRDRIVFTAVAALVAAAVGFVTAGILFSIGLAGAGGLAAWAIAPWVPRWLDGASMAARGVFTGGALVAALLLETLALRPSSLASGSALAFAGLALVCASASTLPRILEAKPVNGGARGALSASRAVAALVLFGGGAFLAPSPSGHVEISNEAVTGFIHRAPVAGRIFAVAARLDPPPLREPPPPPEPPPPDIAFDATGRDVVLVTIDSLRADHVGAYGYDRGTTPSLDALAKDGAVFDAAYTASPHTSYAVTSLLCGKYMKPLLAMEIGADSPTWPELVKDRGYRTFALHPPGMLALDEARFTTFAERRLGFEVVHEEVVPAAQRARDVVQALDERQGGKPAFFWVHFDEPREPYEAHDGFDYGARDVDRYDAEIAVADRALGDLVRDVRARRPTAIIIVTADHGEEFGDHGGRYHGATVYEEQVRVPLVVSAPGLVRARRIVQPVQQIDLLPTMLMAVRAPRPPRLRGRDLGGLLSGIEDDDPTAGIAHADSDDMTLLARGPRRLVCLKRAGACALYDTSTDPRERRDVASSFVTELSALKNELRSLEGAHGHHEREGREHPGPDLPEPLRRGLAGDPEVALEVSRLLEDRDVTIRRQAAKVLFELADKHAAPAIRAANAREEDPEAKAYLALVLVRMGEGAPYVFELLEGRDLAKRRLAALALAEAGDDRGEGELIRWWLAAFPRNAPARADVLPFDRARQVVEALAGLRSDLAVGSLLRGLADARLRPYVARALAKIGEDAARPALAEHLMIERYVTSRVAITEALLSLGAGPDLRDPLVSMLGMPDPLPNGVSYAIKARMLKHVGGPSRDAELGRLQRFATSGVIVDFVVPELTKNAVPAPGEARVRVICRGSAAAGGEVRVGPRGDLPKSSEKKAPIPKNRPELDASRSVTLTLPKGDGATEVFGDLPPSTGIRPGKYASLVFYVTQGVELEACVLVPLRRELAP